MNGKVQDFRQGVGLSILAAYFISGAGGLAHEVVWTRLLRHVMGNTTFSITTVVCCFMGGLALGSFVGGRFIDRYKKPLRVFAILEASVAVYCLLLPGLIQGVEPLYRAIYQHTHTSFYVFSLIRFVFSGSLLLIPATFMGATLPVLTYLFVNSSQKAGSSIGTLYAINTFGAVLGGTLTGLLLIPYCGLSRTILIASLMNAIAAGIAFFLERFAGMSSVQGSPQQEHDEARVTGESKQHRAEKIKKHVKNETFVKEPSARLEYGSESHRYLLVGYAFSGFSALMLEIAWTRALSLLIGSTVYAFSMILTAFILGIALGSMIFSKIADKIYDPLLILAVIQVGIGLTALVAVPVIGYIPFIMTGLITRFSASFWQLQAFEFAFVLSVIILPTLFMGAAFPLAGRLMTVQREKAGAAIGTLYAFNTIGNIAGSFMAGFVLIPFVGLEKTLFIASLISVMVAILFFLRSGSLTIGYKAIWSFTAGIIVVVAIWAIPAWNVSKMSFGPFYEAVRLTKNIAKSPSSLKEISDQRKVLYHKEGIGATVTVKQFPGGSLALYINGKPDASSLGDLPSQELVAHIPLLMHPDPKSALVIGLASGISLGSAGQHPLNAIDCVEISKEMIEASSYFAEYNYDILDDSRVNLIIGDGRNHLLLTDRTYDVIISEPSNPYFAGVADLFTREYFQLMYDRLSENGIASAWVQTYMIDKESVRSVLKAFQSVFPETMLWKTEKGDSVMMGSKVPLRVAYGELKRRLAQPEIRDDLARIGIDSVSELLSHIIMGKKGLGRFTEGAVLHTDDNALVEFAAPRALAGADVFQWDLMEAMERQREADLEFLERGTEDQAEMDAVKRQTADFITASGEVFKSYFYFNKGENELRLEALSKAAALNPQDELLHEAFDLLRKEAYTLATTGRNRDAIALYRQMVRILPNDPKAHFNLAIMLKRENDLNSAFIHFQEAVKAKPDYTVALYNLGEIAETQLQIEDALRFYRQALEVDGQYIPALNNLSRLLASRVSSDKSNGTEAVNLAEKGCSLTSNQDARLLYTLSVAYAAEGRFQEAGSVAALALDIAQKQRNTGLVEAIKTSLRNH